MKRGDNIELRGFGSFKVVKQLNALPETKTNVEVIVPEQFVPVLKVSKDFNEVVNDSMAVKFDFKNRIKFLFLRI